MWIASFIAAGVLAGLPLLWALLPQKVTLPVDLWFEAKGDVLRKRIAKREKEAQEGKVVYVRPPSGSELQK